MRKSRIIKGLYVFMIGLFMVAAPSALAVTNDTSVVNSGNNANVNSNTTQNTSATVTNTNTAVVDQVVNAHSNTGGNDANRNIGGAGITTGNAGVDVMMTTQANKNTTALDMGMGGTSANTTDVVNTGDNSHVNTSTNTNSSTTVTNDNMATVTQSCGGMGITDGLFGPMHMGMGGCSANTGGNDANRNIGGAGVTTGNAGIAVGMDNHLNQNMTAIAGNNGAGLTNGTTITNTGNNANINSNATTNSSTSVANSNVASIMQWLDAHANTGYNDANRNIGGTGITTGAAGIEMLMGTHANSNTTGIGNGMSSALSNLDNVVNTGDNLNNGTSVLSNSSASLANLNTMVSSQHVYEYTNSGKNDANSNVGDPGIGTHFAGITLGMSTTANENGSLFGGLLGSLLNMFL